MASAISFWFAVILSAASLALITLLLPGISSLFAYVVRSMPDVATLNFVFAVPVAVMAWKASRVTWRKSRLHWAWLMAILSLCGMATVVLAASVVDAKFESEAHGYLCWTALTIVPQVGIAIVAAGLAPLRAETGFRG
jgi:hypothetical protein